MGLRTAYLEWFEEECDKVLGEMHPVVFGGRTMLEMGNQVLKHNDPYLAAWLKAHRLPGSLRTGKELFSAMGFFHVSVDLNGLDGTIVRDLREPFGNDLAERFDIVTSFGTAEHVSNQFMFWRNVQFACREHGMVFVVVPAEGLKHGRFQYPRTFFHLMVAQTGATTLRCEEVILFNDGKKTPATVVVAAWIAGGKFLSEEDFDRHLLPLLRTGGQSC